MTCNLRRSGVSSRAAGAALALALFAGCERTQTPNAPSTAPATPSKPPCQVRLSPSVVEVASGIRLLGETFPNACYVIETADGLALVDTCPDADAGPVLEQMRAAGLDVARLRWILLTHAHGDHSLGARKLRELTGAKVHAGRGDTGVLRRGGSREAFFSVFEMPFQAHATTIDVELDGHEVLDLGGTKIRVIATPGHTPGSVCYLLERDGERILFTGDVVSSLTDAAPLSGPAIYSAYLSQRFRGEALAYRGSLQKLLLSMPAPDVVLPGHPRADPVPQDPRISRERWESLLTRAIAKLETLVARLQRDGADFLDGVPKELLAGLHYLGDGERHAIYAVTTGPAECVLFGAPDVPDPAAFLEERAEAAGLPPPAVKAVVLTSSSPRETRGLPRLVAATGCAVVAPRDALPAIRALCRPETHFLAAEDLASAGWLPVEVTAIDAPDHPSVAYALSWQGATVLFPGRFPATLASRQGVEGFRSQFPSRANVRSYLTSLDRLAHLAPDLWLPLVPYQDQNANVYDDAWRRAIESNRRALRQ